MPRTGSSRRFCPRRFSAEALEVDGQLTTVWAAQRLVLRFRGRKTSKLFPRTTGRVLSGQANAWIRFSALIDQRFGRLRFLVIDRNGEPAQSSNHRATRP